MSPNVPIEVRMLLLVENAIIIDLSKDIWGTIYHLPLLGIGRHQVTYFTSMFTSRCDYWYDY